MRGKDFCTKYTHRIIEDSVETSERSIDIHLSFNHLALIYKRFLNFLKFNEAKCLEFFGGGGGGPSVSVWLNRTSRIKCD